MNSSTAAGSVLGSRYVLDHRVAVGGMGEVWKATDQVLERPVAVKLLRADLIDSEDFRRRFRVEARLAAGLPHPGIAHVYDYAEDDCADGASEGGQRLAFLVMEFVDGQPLSDRLARRDPMPLGEILSILDQTSQALGAAHSVGIVHRDVKPGNVLINPDGRVKVTDFGIARAINSADITEVGQVIGTARYMSPEQARGEEVTPASDIYSLAVIGYEMLSGHTPFTGDNPVAIAWAHVQSAPPALPASVPAELRSLITQSLSKLPEHRPSDGASFASALQRITIEPAPATVGSTAWSAPVARQTQPNAGVPSTAVFEHPATTIGRSPDSDEAPTETASVPSSRSDEPLLAGGWVQRQRVRRRVAAYGAVLAVALCLLGLIVFNGADRNPSVASEPTVTTAPPLAVSAVVTIDPAAYLGLDEADARAALTAAGMTVVTSTAPSTADLANLVIDVQPTGPIAPGSSVTITLGDGTTATVADPVAPVADPVADGPVANDPGSGHDAGNGKDKAKNKGKGKD